jgi:hypothetical protein
VAYYYPGSTYDRQSRRAVIAQDIGQWDTPLPLLTASGEVAPVGDEQFSTVRPIAYYARLRSRDYTWIQSFELNVFAELPFGQQSTDNLPPRAAARSRTDNYQYLDPTEIWLIGQDAINPGQQFTANPPRGAARSRDYTFIESLDNRLLGQDAINPGQQVGMDLPPRGRARAASFDPGANYTLALDAAAQAQVPAGKSTTATEPPPRAAQRSRDYTYIDPTEIWLIGQDAVVTGKQFTDLPPKAAPRQRDYTWLQSFALPVYGELPFGQQSQPNPPRAAQRAATLSEPGYNLTVWLDFAAAQVPPPGQSTTRTESPPRAYARSRDYSFVYPAQTQLFGQDALVTGAQSTALPPRGPQRAAQLYDPGTNQTLALAASTGPVGAQSTELPSRGQMRSRDYTFLHATDQQLIGQDSMVPGKSTDATALPMRAAARSRDYTWLQSMPLHIYQQLPPGQSTANTELPPRGPLRLKDYTFLDLTKQNLIGQDFMVPGQSTLRTDNLPPRAYPRLRDYTYLVRFDLPELAASLHPGKQTVTDRALYEHTLSNRALYVHTVSDSVTVQ